jgi:membrane protein implicated in regulation of membrane protease activity
MPWWSWMIIGGLLLGAELFFVEADFYLVFLGVAAIASGLLAANIPGLPIWAHWIFFAGLSIVSMVLFRRRVYAALRPQVADRKDDLIGERIQIPADLPADAQCRVDHRGTTWNAHNVGSVSIAAGTGALITGVRGITLRIEAE